MEKVEGDGYHIFTDIRIERRTFRVLIDSGASKSVFDKILIRQLKSVQIVENSENIAAGIGEGLIETRLGVIPEIRIKRLLVSDLTVAFIDFSPVHEAYKKLSLKPFSGIIGGDILYKYGAVINYNKSTLQLYHRK